LTPGGALAHLRAGHLDEAVRQAQSSYVVDPNWHASALNRVVLALAHARLGQREEARKWLETTHRTPRPPPASGSETEVIGAVTSWWDRADLLILRREADVLILDSQLSSDPFHN
jgi:hypothetical protein